MTPPRPTLLATVVVLALVAACAGADTPAPERDATETTMRPDPDGPCAEEPWMASDSSPEERARALVATMDLDQKLAQVHGRTDEDGPLVPGIAELCIPDLRLTDGRGPAGSGSTAASTALPSPIALAATWDPVQAASYGDVLAAEALHDGSQVVIGPVVDIARVPTAGGTHEGLGEDPVLASALAVAQIRAVQDRGVLASVAHLVADTQRTDRDTVDARVPPRALHEVYLAPFEAAVVDGGVASVTCAPNRVDGTHACESPSLLTTVLRDEWGFEGFVASTDRATGSTEAAVAAGLDLEPAGNGLLGEPLAGLVDAGTVPVEALDRMLERRYRPMFRLGVFDRTGTPPGVSVEEHGAIAAGVATSGTVLLRNEGDLLPLADDVASLAVVGPASTVASTGHPLPGDRDGDGGREAPRRVTTVEGIGARAGDEMEVVLPTDGSVAAAVTAAGEAEVAVVVVGDEPDPDSDRPTLALPAEQDALVSAVAAANDRTVVVVQAGGPVLMPWVEEVGAVLMGWYPGGEDGNVTASLLFGDAEPGGRLPITFPAHDLAVPAIDPERYPGVGGVATYAEGTEIGYRFVAAGGPEPLFAFGHGLGYTTFEVSGLVVPELVEAGEPVTVEVDVTNTGDRRGSHVVQVYAASPPSVGAPARRLVGFARVTVDPGGTTTVTVELAARAFQHWDEAAGGWASPGGLYRLHVGSASDDLPLSAEVRVG